MSKPDDPPEPDTPPEPAPDDDSSGEPATTPPDGPDIPVEGVENIQEVLANPQYLRDWLANLSPPNLNKTMQATGESQNHTVGENMVSGLELKRWPSVLEDLETTPHPVTGKPPHSILQHPRSMLDSLIHTSERDNWNLDYNNFDGLPRNRKHTFEWLVDPDTPVAPSDLEATGGTDALIYGPMGRGKTTVVQVAIARLMEINNEAVVWRGTSQRTEWLPLAPWTIACLPEGVDYEVELAPPEANAAFDHDVDTEPISVDLEDIVWEVRRYEDIEDLNQNVLTPGGFHVVYPDPHFRGATAATRRAEECKTLQHTPPAAAAADGEEPTPPRMWWYAWLVHHNALGRSMRLTWVCDEASNLFQEHAGKGDHDILNRIKAVSQQYVDFRRNGLSFFLLTQKPKEISWRIRKKMRWAITLSGTSNPTTEEIIGVRPPMRDEMTSYWELGEALWWGAEYTSFEWDEIPSKFKVPGKLRVRPQVEVHVDD